MALSDGTNCGFCLASPSADPNETAYGQDNAANVAKFTSPVDAETIIEFGWYCSINDDEGENFEIGLYAADGGVVPGEAGTLLYSDTSNILSAGVGWKKITGLSWSISGSTDYWLGVQLDNSTEVKVDYKSFGFAGIDRLTNQISLPNPFAGGALLDSNATMAYYVIYTTAVVGNAGIMTPNAGFWGPTF